MEERRNTNRTVVMAGGLARRAIERRQAHYWALMEADAYGYDYCPYPREEKRSWLMRLVRRLVPH